MTMGTNNLPKLIALEKLTKEVIHGDIALELHIVDKAIARITAKGTKKTLYNNSENDINTNQTAMHYVIERMAKQVETSASGIITFRISTKHGKIKYIEMESTHIIE